VTEKRNIALKTHKRNFIRHFSGNDDESLEMTTKSAKWKQANGGETHPQFGTRE